MPGIGGGHFCRTVSWLSKAQGRFVLGQLWGTNYRGDLLHARLGFRVDVPHWVLIVELIDPNIFLFDGRFVLFVKRMPIWTVVADGLYFVVQMWGTDRRNRRKRSFPVRLTKDARFQQMGKRLLPSSAAAHKNRTRMHSVADK